MAESRRTTGRIFWCVAEAFSGAPIGRTNLNTAIELVGEDDWHTAEALWPARGTIDAQGKAAGMTSWPGSSCLIGGDWQRRRMK